MKKLSIFLYESNRKCITSNKRTKKALYVFFIKSLKRSVEYSDRLGIQIPLLKMPKKTEVQTE